MVGQHQMGLCGQMETPLRADPPLMQALDLRNQTSRVDDRPAGIGAAVRSLLPGA